MAGTPLPRLLFALVLYSSVFLGPISKCRACDFCAMQDRTLTKQVGESSLVLFGTLTKADQDANGDGTTDFKIDIVVKKHDILGDKKTVTLARYLPFKEDDQKKIKFLVLCDVFKGKIDPLFLVQCKADSEIAKYLKGAIEVKDKETQNRLKFFSPYLASSETEISTDAFKEFALASNKDIQAISKTLNPDSIIKWLEDANTPSMRYGVYGMMLGYCGKAEHAKRVRALLDHPRRRMSSIDGLLAGYTLLDPKEGWVYLTGLLKDEKQEFMTRYASLRALRFFHNTATDVIDKKEILKAMGYLLDQNDIADLAIEDLRKWECWDLADKVLSLYALKSHDVPIIRRSILRYALQCPDKKAVALVDGLRKKDKQMVEDTEELLKLEVAPPAKAPAPGK